MVIKSIFLLMFITLSAIAKPPAELKLLGDTQLLKVEANLEVIEKNLADALGITALKIIDSDAIIKASDIVGSLPQSTAEPELVVVSENGSPTLGISNGEMIIEYSDFEEIDGISRDYMLSLVDYLMDLNRVVLRVNKISALENTVNLLQQDERVVSVELLVNYGDLVPQ